VEIQPADVEIRLTPGSSELTEVPALFWRERKASFMICRIGDNLFRPQFFYTPGEQYSTGRASYDNLAECVTALLQCQADDERGGGVGPAQARTGDRHGPDSENSAKSIDTI
jgi:hypothetical protein